MKKIAYVVVILLGIGACTASLTIVSGDGNQVTKDFDNDTDCDVSRRVDLGSVRDTFNVKMDSDTINLKKKRYE